MENNKCGCEDIKKDKEIEEKIKEDTGCGCGEEIIKTPEEDVGCGCSSENTEASEDGGCGCGAIDFPDLSRVENPDKPKFTATTEFVEEFEDYAHSLGISSVGYTLLSPELLIRDKFVQYPFTIVLTMEMSNEIIETPPGADAKDLNDTTYVKLAILTTKLSDYLRKNGFATEIAHPYGGLVNFSALGQEAGLGYIGESGLLITPELGPRQKISAIFTSISNLPINEKNEHAWIPEYCNKCGKCVKACPEKALVEKETCCGGTEIELIQKKCIGCSQGCTYCIESCPFEEKGYKHVKNKFDKMNAKLQEKQAKKFKVELWNNWAKQNSNMFNGLVNGSTIVIAMTENKERLIFLEKEENNLKANIKPLNHLESSGADLLFVMDEKDIEEILNTDDHSKFTGLLSSGKVEIYGLRDHLQLMDKGYMAFLNNLGLSLGGRSCCG
ncbi:4Fe-4S binding protein [Methanobacterium sp. ACI-7]|uniref:4Fe-4S binding protein n=1 Tax=unclassified Methanobacterium TaxID=2627676 RepID=UPI0039C255F5